MTAEEIQASLRDEGATHILLNRGGLNFIRNTDSRYTEQDWAELDRFLDQMQFETNYFDVYELYKISP